MNDTAATSAAHALPVGVFQVQSQEQIVFGKPAEVAVLELARQRGARRVFLTSGPTLGGLRNGPLQPIAHALGDLPCGTFPAIPAHMPPQGVTAGAPGARGDPARRPGWRTGGVWDASPPSGEGAPAGKGKCAGCVVPAGLGRARGRQGGRFGGGGGGGERGAPHTNPPEG